MSLIFSTSPEDWDLQCKWHTIPRDFNTHWVTVVLKAEPLSLWRLHGSPNLGIISWIKILITSLACSLSQGKALIHPVKVSTQTCKQENPFVFGVWIKATTASFIIHKSWISLHSSLDFFTPKIGVLHGQLQGISCPWSFKFSVIGFNPSLISGFSGYCFWCGNRWGSLHLIKTGTAFCVWSTIFPSAHTLGFTFCSINGRERAGSIFMKIETWTLLSMSLPRMSEGDSVTIRNSWENSTESQLQLKGWLK